MKVLRLFWWWLSGRRAWMLVLGEFRACSYVSQKTVEETIAKKYGRFHVVTAADVIAKARSRGLVERNYCNRSPDQEYRLTRRGRMVLASWRAQYLQLIT